MKIVILGAGQAGVQVALSLRQKGFDGELVLVGDEHHLPYQRPPLSKAFLKGETDAAGLALRPAATLAEQTIQLRLGQRAEAIDRATKTVRIAGEDLSYDRLVLALGTRPRALTLPGADLPGVLSLRGIDDAEQLLFALNGAQDVVIVGGGFIGLEVAATAAAKGKTVTVLEAGSRVMARAVAPQVSEWFQCLHAGMGSRIVTEAKIAAFAGKDHVEAVVLTDGTKIKADLVLTGVGAVPNDEIAVQAGLDCPNGIRVDAFGATTDPAIYSAGDCTLHPNRFADGLFRLESVQNAIDQAKIVAGSLLGETTGYDAVPWFWSDQGTAKLQTTGLPVGTDTHVTRGVPAAGRFTVFHLKGGQVIAADSVNSPADHMCARRMVAMGLTATPALLADPATDLKSLISQRTA